MAPAARGAHTSSPLCDRPKWSYHGDKRQHQGLYLNMWPFDFYGETLFTHNTFTLRNVIFKPTSIQKTFLNVCRPTSHIVTHR